MRSFREFKGIFSPLYVKIYAEIFGEEPKVCFSITEAENLRTVINAYLDTNPCEEICTELLYLISRINADLRKYCASYGDLVTTKAFVIAYCHAEGEEGVEDATMEDLASLYHRENRRLLVLSAV